MNKIVFLFKKKLLVLLTTVLMLGIFNPLVTSQNIEITEDEQPQYDLLIITIKKYTGSLNKLVEHKCEVGFSTQLVTLDEIYNGKYFSVNGTDNPEKIKYFIKDAFEQWGVKYVLLVGGAKQIPVRYSNVHCFNLDEPDWQNHLIKSSFVSDLYYADIIDEFGNFSSWDSNDNGIYGEWTGESAEDKNIDLYPDVYLGRLPCRNIFEVRIMVNKIITYEKNTYNQSWFKNVVAVAGDTDPRYWIPRWRKYEGEVTANIALEYMDGFNKIKLYPSNGNLEGRGDVIKAINKGCGFIYFNGHGNPLGVLTFKSRSEEWVRCIDVYTIPFLFNGNKLPICIIGSCSGCNFDVSVSNIFNSSARAEALYAPECWGWWMTRKIGGGSIATIGGTSIGFVNLDKQSGIGGGSYLEKRFFWEYGVNNTEILGQVWGNAISNYLDTFPINWSGFAGGDSSLDAETLEHCVLLGDPTLKIGGYE